MTLLKCHGWSGLGPCGFVSEDVAEYQTHLMGHYSTRLLSWNCHCGRFGEGRADLPGHTTPLGELCEHVAGSQGGMITIQRAPDMGQPVNCAWSYRVHLSAQDDWSGSSPTEEEAWRSAKALRDRLVRGTA